MVMVLWKETGDGGPNRNLIIGGSQVMTNIQTTRGSWGSVAAQVRSTGSVEVKLRQGTINATSGQLTSYFAIKIR